MPVEAVTTKRSRATRAAALTTGLVLAGGAAFAWWSAGGSGTGTATTATPSSLEIVQTSTVTGLAPGASAQTLSGTFNNTNQSSVYVTSVTAAIDHVSDTNDDPIVGCDETDYTLSNAVMSVGAEIASGNAEGAWTGATLAFNNKPTNQDACKGAVVHLAYSAS